MTKKSYKEQKNLALKFLENVRKQDFVKAIEILNTIEKNENYFWNEVWNETGEDSETDANFLIEFLNYYSLNSENSIYWNLIKSIQLFNAGLKEEAYQHLLDLVNMEFQTTSLYYDSLGRISFRLKKQDEAISYFEKAIEIDPEQTVLYNNLGYTYCYQENYEKGIPCLEKGIGLDSDYPIIYSHLGDAFFELEEFNQTIENYTKAIELDSNNALYCSALGDAFCQLREYDNAIIFFKKAIELNPKNPIYFNSLGHVYFELKDYQSAVKFYDEAIKLDSGKAFYYANNANAYYELKKYESAIGFYNKAILLNPENAMYYSNIADVYFELKEYEKAFENLKKSIELDSENPMFVNSLGNYYFKLEDYSKAIEFYKKASELDLNNAIYFYNLGSCYSELYEYDKTIEYYSKAIELKQDKLLYHHNLGYAYTQLKEYDLAIESYNRAIALDSTHYTSYLNSSFVYYIKKEYNKCKDTLIEVIELSSKSPDVLSFSLFVYKNIFDDTKDKEFHALYKNAFIELSKIEPEKAFKAYEEQNEELENLFKKEKEYDEQKKLISFLSHTFTNALGSEHQTLESSIKSLQKGKAESNWNLVGSSLNRLISLSGNFLQLENLIRFFKLIVREPEEFQKQWESDIEEEISVQFIFALILRHLFSNLLYSSDPAIRIKLFGENTDWNALRQSFDETILQIELREEDDSISNYIKWVKSNCPQVHFLIEDNTTKLSKFGIRMNSIYAVMGEFIQNALKYSKQGTKVQFEWKREGSEISFFCRNEFDDQSTKTQGTKKGKYFIDKLTDILKRQGFVIPKFEDKDGNYKTSFQITFKDEIK